MKAPPNHKNLQTGSRSSATRGLDVIRGNRRRQASSEQNTPMIKIYKSPEAAKLISVCVRTLNRMRKDGRLKALRTGPGGHYLYREEDLLRAIGLEPQPAPGGHVTTIDTSPPDLSWRNANGDHVVHEDMDEAEVDRD